MGLSFGLESLSVLSFGLEMILLDQLVKLAVGSVGSGGCLSLSEGNGEPEGVTTEKSSLQHREDGSPSWSRESSSPP